MRQVSSVDPAPPGIQLAEVNRLAAEWISDTGRVILADSPEKEGLAVPSEADLLAVFRIKLRDFLVK